MIIYEGYKKAVEIYNTATKSTDGTSKVTWYNNHLGISKEYLVWFTRLVNVDNIPLYKVVNLYRDWKKYVIQYHKDNNSKQLNIESLTYKQVRLEIDKAKRYYAKPNPIYDNNGIYIGEFKSFKDAAMLPIDTTWCITKMEQRFNQFNNDECISLYIINQHNNDPIRRIIAVIYADRVEYWDSKNVRLEENEKFEKTLPNKVVDMIYSYKAKCKSVAERLSNIQNVFNKRLYESIMRDVAKIVKKHLNQLELDS